MQKKLLTLPVSFFDNQKAGALVSRVMTDVEGVRNLGTGLVQLIGGSITAIISLIILININAMMTLFVLLPVGIFALIALKVFGYIRPIFRERGKINAEVTGRLTETLNGIRVIKGFNAEDQEQKTFEAGVERLFLNVKKSLTATAFMTSTSYFFAGHCFGRNHGDWWVFYYVRRFNLWGVRVFYAISWLYDCSHCSNE